MNDEHGIPGNQGPKISYCYEYKWFKELLGDGRESKCNQVTLRSVWERKETFAYIPILIVF